MTRRIGLIFAVGFLALLGSTQAAIVSCGNTTLSALIALGSGGTNGCQVDDKLFNSFTYTPLAGAPVSSLVNANLVANNSTLTYGWTFSSASGSFQGDFALGYTVTIVTSGRGACALCVITSSQEQIFAGNAPPSPVTVSVAESAGTTPVVVNNATFGNNTNGSAFVGVLSLTKYATTWGITSATPLLSFESDIRQTVSADPRSVVPEPATFGLMGIGMLSLGLLRRRS